MTPPKMEEHIGEMIRLRFLEGQLDDCELTLRDLSKIREAFLKILVGIHHQRIKYPGQSEPPVPPGVALIPAATGADEPAGEAEETTGAGGGPPPDSEGTAEADR